MRHRRGGRPAHADRGAQRCVLHSVTAPARVSRASLPLIQNSTAPFAHLQPSAESTCGSLKERRYPEKVSRTVPVRPGALKTAWTAVPSGHRCKVSVANAELTGPIKATDAINNLMQSFLCCYRAGELDHELKSPLDAEKHKIKEGVCSVAEGDNGLPAQRHSRP